MVLELADEGLEAKEVLFAAFNTDYFYDFVFLLIFDVFAILLVVFKFGLGVLVPVADFVACYYVFVEGFDDYDEFVVEFLLLGAG